MQKNKHASGVRVLYSTCQSSYDYAKYCASLLLIKLIVMTPSSIILYYVCMSVRVNYSAIIEQQTVHTSGVIVLHMISVANRMCESAKLSAI